MQKLRERQKKAKQQQNAEKAVTELQRKENWVKLKQDMLPVIVDKLTKMRRLMRKAGEQKLDELLKDLNVIRKVIESKEPSQDPDLPPAREQRHKSQHWQEFQRQRE